VGSGACLKDSLLLAIARRPGAHCLQDVSNLGAAGDKVVVSQGYARNYLIPQRLADAVPKTREVQKELRLERQVSFCCREQNFLAIVGGNIQNILNSCWRLFTGQNRQQRRPSTPAETRKDDLTSVLDVLTTKPVVGFVILLNASQNNQSPRPHYR
jgi:Ribosomal protein L9, N-terminal domain